jgi:hypothetical protein
VLDPYLTRAQGVALTSGDTIWIADGGRASPSSFPELSASAKLPPGFTAARLDASNRPVLNRMFKQLFAGGRMTCGQSLDGSNPRMRCWGENGDWELQGSPKAVGATAVGKAHVCYQVRMCTVVQLNNPNQTPTKVL